MTKDTDPPRRRGAAGCPRAAQPGYAVLLLWVELGEQRLQEVPGAVLAVTAGC